MGDNVEQAKGIANMARVFDLETASDDIRENLARSIQSANLNFLIGSGALVPRNSHSWRGGSRNRLPF